MFRIISLFIASALAAEAPPPVTMTRAEAQSAYSVLAQIGQYQTVITQAGQQVAVTKFLDVTSPMRSTLTHDILVLKEVANETSKLHEDAKTRVGEDKAALDKEDGVILNEKISINGLILFSESDLNLDKNPQITPSFAAALSVLEKHDN